MELTTTPITACEHVVEPVADDYVVMTTHPTKARTVRKQDTDPQDNVMSCPFRITTCKR